MVSTRDFKETVAARARHDPAFVRALVVEAITLFKNGEPEAAKQILADLLSVSLDAQTLTAEIGDPRHEAMVAIHETMQAMHQIGAVDRETMDEINKAYRPQAEALEALRAAVALGLKSGDGQGESAQAVFDRLEAKYRAMILHDDEGASR